MTNTTTRSYSDYCLDALQVLAKLITLHRKAKKMTAQELADRVGICRSTLYKIEKGDAKCEIGVVFELCSVLGICLFNSDGGDMARFNEAMNDKLALLPQAIRKKTDKVDDQF
ncbi:MAG: helix-turn-helix transcriptional regulator [Coxiellaceae bacterium]|nr:helix-turn-helix transcriptional regulator [Coxiellaceae bacterium]